MCGRGVGEVCIVHRSGRENSNADALSRSPLDLAPDEGDAEGETQIAVVHAVEDASGPDLTEDHDAYALEQSKDPKLKGMRDYLLSRKLPSDRDSARRVVAQEPLFTLISNILYYVDLRRNNRRRVAVPQHLQEKLIEENHRGSYGGHFSGERIYNSLVRRWWWDGMYADALRYCKRCPECAVVTGGGHQRKPPLQPILVERPFQIVAVDIMELPCTDWGNKYAVVFQDLFTKWPMVFATPDQKSERIVKLLCEEVVPVFGVPELLLSDRGTNLLSHLMLVGYT